MLVNALDRLQKIADRVPGVVYEYRMRPDGSSSFPFISDACRHIFRVSPEEVRTDATKVLACIHPDDLAGVQSSIEQSAQELALWQHEYRVKFDDGAVRWMHGNGLPNRASDGGVLWHGFTIDITERKLLEDDLRISDQALKATSQGVVIISPDLCILSVNAAFETMTGYAKAELLGQHCGFLEGPLSHLETANTIHHALKEGLEFSGEMIHYRKNGDIYWSALNISPVRNAQAQLCHFVVVARDVSVQKELEQRLQLSASVFTHAREGITITDAQGLIVEVNQAFSRITGYSHADAVGQNPRLLKSGRQDQAFYEAMWLDLLSRGYWSGEIWNKRKSGEIYPEKITINAVHDALGNIDRFVAIFTDITESKRLEVEIKDAKEYAENIVESVREPLLVLNADLKILTANHSFYETFKVTSADTIGNFIYDLGNRQWDIPKLRVLFEEVLPNSSVFNNYEVDHNFLGIGHKTILLNAREIYRENIGSHIILLAMEDITERKQLEDQVRQLAFYDSLTQLPNRRLLNDRLVQLMVASKRSACHCAVMVLDLDNFKPLNDTRGHLVGDLLLIEAARRLSSCLREMDTVARFGGDEFVVLLGELDANKAVSVEQALLVAEKIRASVSAVYQLKGTQEGAPETCIEHRCTASIGVVVFLNDQSTHEGILNQADAAMYQAKAAGRNRVRLYDANVG
jgi:diguanylate cyclase (GGDEF)-like protein/PAS domain S-box-containing protein